MNPFPRIEMKLNPSSSYPVQVNDFLQNYFGRNPARSHKEFKCYFLYQGPQNTIPSHKLYPIF